MSNRAFSVFVICFLLHGGCELSTNVYKEGKGIYVQWCSSCHGIDQQGLGSLYPPLTDLSAFSTSIGEIPCLIRLGSGAINGGDSLMQMPALTHLTDVEISNVLNYLNSLHWKLPEVQLNQIRHWLTQCEGTQK